MHLVQTISKKIKGNADKMTAKPTNNLEIERKFLVTQEIPNLQNGIEIVQAYLFISTNKELRIRIIEGSCMISIKFDLEGIVREEYEYEIPLEQGKRLIELGSTKPPISKIRYTLFFEDLWWEIDFFKKDNQGLVVAEIEVNHPNQKVALPPWVGTEVTNDRRYYNVNLYENPYVTWE